MHQIQYLISQKERKYILLFLTAIYQQLLASCCPASFASCRMVGHPARPVCSAGLFSLDIQPVETSLKVLCLILISVDKNPLNLFSLVCNQLLLITVLLVFFFFFFFFSPQPLLNLVSHDSVFSIFRVSKLWDSS